MQKPDVPSNEAERQAELERTGLLQSGSDIRFDHVTRVASELFSVPISLVSLIDNDRQWFKSRQGLDAEETPRSISFCGHAILDNEPLVVEDTLKDERFADNALVCGYPGVRFYAGVPLKTPNGFCIGTLCIIDNKPRNFSQQQLQSLISLAAIVEGSIETDFKARASHQRFESALEKEQRHAELVLESTGIGCWEWNIQTGEAIFNERWAHIVGFTLEELQPISIDTWKNLTHPDDLAESEARLKAHFAGDSEHYDCKCRMQHKDKHWVWVHARGKVFEWTKGGQPLLMCGTHADISNDIATQQALQQSRDSLAAIVNNMPGVTYRCLYDDNWTMVFISSQMDRVSGYSASELINNKSISYAQLIHPEDEQRIGRMVADAIAKDKSWHIEYRILHKDGRWRWVEERGCRVDDQMYQQPLLEGFIVDITREKEVQRKFEKTNNAFSVLSEIAFSKYDSLNDKISFALSQANSFLNMSVAILSEIDYATYLARWVDAPEDSPLTAGQQFQLTDTWCYLLAQGGGLLDSSELFIDNATLDKFNNKSCAQINPLGSYVGIVILVEGQPFGTLDFSSPDSREGAFDEIDVMFVRLLARWLSDTLTVELSNERFSKLIQQLPGTVYQFRQFPDGRVTFPYSSESIEQLYGLTPKEALKDAVPAFNRIHANDLENVTQSIQYSAESMTDWLCTYRVGSLTSGYHWVGGRATPEKLQDGSTLWHGFIYDIHDQELARRRLINSEERLRGLFEFSPIGIALTDYKTGQFIDLNDALLASTGYTRDEFVALSSFDVTPVEYKQKEQRALGDMQTRARYGPYEKEYIRKDGSRYPVRLQGMVSEERNGRKVIWSLIEDITERRKLDQMKDQFIATVSHELRTPLTSIRGALDLLDYGAAGALPGKAKTLVQNAKRNAYRLSNLINDLLDIEKLVAGEVRMKLRKQLLMPIINEVIESMQGYRDSANVTILFTGEPYNGLINVDDERLAQALRNLVSNAIKFSPANGRVELSVVKEEANVSINVRDNGPGVAPEFQEKLFQRFAQADSGDSRKLPGTGLGLSITREIVTQLGGQVYYQDAVDGGSEFIIELPAAK